MKSRGIYFCGLARYEVLELAGGENKLANLLHTCASSSQVAQTNSGKMLANYMYAGFSNMTLHAYECTEWQFFMLLDYRNHNLPSGRWRGRREGDIVE